LLAASTLGIGAFYANDLRKEDITLLTSCMRVEPAFFAWTCKRAIYLRGLTPSEVKRLNEEAGIVHALAFPDPQDSKEMLELFLKSSVDVNAVGRESGRAALHSLVSSRKVEDIRLLLAHGARTNIRDASGRTPLEYAVALQARFPGERYEPVVALLKASHART
jgi:ankyrin repeat protein